MNLVALVSFFFEFAGIFLRQVFLQFWCNVIRCKSAYASVNSKPQHPPTPGQPPGFCTDFQPGSRDLYHLNCPGVTLGLPGVGSIISVIKVPSCQLMPYEGTCRFKLIYYLLLLSCYKICFKTGGKL